MFGFLGVCFLICAQGVRSSEFVFPADGHTLLRKGKTILSSLSALVRTEQHLSTEDELGSARELYEILEQASWSLVRSTAEFFIGANASEEGNVPDGNPQPLQLVNDRLQFPVITVKFDRYASGTQKRVLSCTCKVGQQVIGGTLQFRNAENGTGYFALGPVVPTQRAPETTEETVFLAKELARILSNAVISHDSRMHILKFSSAQGRASFISDHAAAYLLQGFRATGDLDETNLPIIQPEHEALLVITRNPDLAPNLVEMQVHEDKHFCHYAFALDESRGILTRIRERMDRVDTDAYCHVGKPGNVAALINTMTAVQKESVNYYTAYLRIASDLLDTTAIFAFHTARAVPEFFLADPQSQNLAKTAEPIPLQFTFDPLKRSVTLEVQIRNLLKTTAWVGADGSLKGEPVIYSSKESSPEEAHLEDVISSVLNFVSLVQFDSADKELTITSQRGATLKFQRAPPSYVEVEDTLNGHRSRRRRLTDTKNLDITPSKQEPWIPLAHSFASPLNKGSNEELLANDAANTTAQLIFFLAKIAKLDAPLQLIPGLALKPSKSGYGFLYDNNLVIPITATVDVADTGPQILFSILNSRVTMSLTANKEIYLADQVANQFVHQSVQPIQDFDVAVTVKGIEPPTSTTEMLISDLYHRLIATLWETRRLSIMPEGLILRDSLKPLLVLETVKNYGLPGFSLALKGFDGVSYTLEALLPHQVVRSSIVPHASHAVSLKNFDFLSWQHPTEKAEGNDIFQLLQNLRNIAFDKINRSLILEGEAVNVDDTNLNVSSKLSIPRKSDELLPFPLVFQAPPAAHSFAARPATLSVDVSNENAGHTSQKTELDSSSSPIIIIDRATEVDATAIGLHFKCRLLLSDNLYELHIAPSRITGALRVIFATQLRREMVTMKNLVQENRFLSTILAAHTVNIDITKREILFTSLLGSISFTLLQNDESGLQGLSVVQPESLLLRRITAFQWSSDADVLVLNGRNVTSSDRKKVLPILFIETEKSPRPLSWVYSVILGSTPCQFKTELVYEKNVYSEAANSFGGKVRFSPFIPAAVEISSTNETTILNNCSEELQLIQVFDKCTFVQLGEFTYSGDGRVAFHDDARLNGVVLRKMSYK